MSTRSKSSTSVVSESIIGVGATKEYFVYKDWEIRFEKTLSTFPLDREHISLL
jgi:hypothetical protein